MRDVDLPQSASRVDALLCDPSHFYCEAIKNGAVKRSGSVDCAGSLASGTRALEFQIIRISK